MKQKWSFKNLGPSARQCPSTHQKACRNGGKGKKKGAVLKWPAMSPDLNPIQNHWGKITSAIRKKNPHIHTQIYKSNK